MANSKGEIYKKKNRQVNGQNEPRGQEGSLAVTPVANTAVVICQNTEYAE